MRLVSTALVLSAAAGSLWFISSRDRARRELMQMLEDSPAVFTARVYAGSAALGPEHNWLKQPGGIRDKAHELLPYTSMNTVDEAYAQALASLPAIPPARGGVLPGIIGQGLDAIAEATGMNIPRSVQQEAAALAKTEQGKQADSILTASSGIWAWAQGQEQERARPNGSPYLEWDSFLGKLR